MIQANELRIGNLLSFHDGTIGIVTGLDSVNIQVNGYYPMLTIKPIPLSEEWLLRFGFEILGILVVQNDFIRLLREDGLCYFHTALLKTKVKTVHQLQNLFYSLTGSELVLSSVPEATKPAL